MPTALTILLIAAPLLAWWLFMLHGSRQMDWGDVGEPLTEEEIYARILQLATEAAIRNVTEMFVPALRRMGEQVVAANVHLEEFYASLLEPNVQEELVT